MPQRLYREALGHFCPNGLSGTEGKSSPVQDSPDALQCSSQPRDFSSLVAFAYETADADAASSLSETYNVHEWLRPTYSHCNEECDTRHPGTMGIDHPKLEAPSGTRKMALPP